MGAGNMRMELRLELGAGTGNVVGDVTGDGAEDGDGDWDGAGDRDGARNGAGHRFGHGLGLGQILIIDQEAFNEIMIAYRKDLHVHLQTLIFSQIPLPSLMFIQILVSA